MNWLYDLSDRIIKNYDLHDLPTLVLHHVGHEESFGLKKAAYFIDNPDFNHFQGIAGFTTSECKLHHPTLWKSPTSFNENKKTARFHKSVEQFADESLSKKSKISPESKLKKIAKELGLTSFDFFSWTLKYGNTAFLLFESGKKLSKQEKELLEHAVSYLSFCPTNRRSVQKDKTPW